MVSPVWRQAINWTLVELLLIESFVNNFQWNVNQNNSFVQEKAFSNVVCKMSMILYQPQYGKYSPVFNVSWTSARCLHMLAQSSSHSNLTNYHNRLRSYIIDQTESSSSMASSLSPCALCDVLGTYIVTTRRPNLPSIFKTSTKRKHLSPCAALLLIPEFYTFIIARCDKSAMYMMYALSSSRGVNKKRGKYERDF